MVPRRAQAEIFGSRDKVPRLYAGGKRGVGVLHDMLGEFWQIRAEMIKAPGSYQIGGDIISEFPHPTFQQHIIALLNLTKSLITVCCLIKILLLTSFFLGRFD